MIFPCVFTHMIMICGGLHEELGMFLFSVSITSCDVLSPLLMVFVQEHYDLTVCGLFYGPSLLYTGQEERLKQRYVHLKQ